MLRVLRVGFDKFSTVLFHVQLKQIQWTCLQQLQLLKHAMNTDWYFCQGCL